MDPPADDAEPHRRLLAFAWLSVAAAVVTIALKGGAAWLTGSVGLLSDALESIVNLVAALAAVVALVVAARPADEEHDFGHDKAEYLSAGFEGSMILVAGATIVVTAVDRLLHPEALDDLGIGLAVSALASAVNLAVGLVLVRVGRAHRSITLEADGRHLLTDVITSVGVIVAVVVVGITGWQPLDPLIALAVAANIVVTGVRLVGRALSGLLDRTLPDEELAAVEAVLDRYRAAGIGFHAVRSREAGQRSFLSFHVLVPGDWTVQRGHDLVEGIDAALRAVVPRLTVMSHLEPIEDPVSYADQGLDRG